MEQKFGKNSIDIEALREFGNQRVGSYDHVSLSKHEVIAKL